MTLDTLTKWDRRFLDLATTVGTWSKGPRKRIGAVIVRPDRSVASMGYNGPPRGFDDVAFLAMTREEQHKVVIHAEKNACRQMSDYEKMIDKSGWTFYISPLHPCHECAETVIAYGFKRVVSYCGQTSLDWAESSEKARRLFIDEKIEHLFVS